MLIPALYSLFCQGRISKSFAVVGVSRTAMSNDDFRKTMRESVERFSDHAPLQTTSWDAFAALLFYVPGDVGEPALYESLKNTIAGLDERQTTGGNVLFYLATQPSLYRVVTEQIGNAGLQRGIGWRRVVVEKPFGRDLASARELNEQIHRVFPESGIYRIDHYLGKETVQNVMAFRFGNGIFEPLWNRRYIDNIQITAAESIGVEGRGGYYQEAGALRDMIQNHLLQVMATIAMEPAAVFEADAVRDERAKLLRSIRIMKPDNVAEYAVAGQYGPSRIGSEELRGFRQEPGVDPNSRTETYAAVTFFVDNWRWAGTPFYLRTGKRLPKRVTDIAIQFNAAPHSPFADCSSEDLRPNLLIIRIQPEEGISLRFLSKQPGSRMRLRPVSMDFNYGSSFGERSPSAYETLLLDAMVGDPTLYTRQDMVEASWAAVQPILDVWSDATFDFPNYPAGSWGPKQADEMLARQGRRWRTP
jgi:glucose-6-phosphate 1-dehydrogenase